MTDNTQPKAREFNMSQYASKDDMIGAMRKRIAELESELEAVGAGGVSGPLMGQPQAMPDLTALTERGAKAWTGVDAQALREGRWYMVTHDGGVTLWLAEASTAGFTAADMATASAQGFRDGVASLSANAGEPVAWQYRSLRDNGAWFDCTKERFEMRCTQPEIWETRALCAAPPTAQAEGWTATAQHQTYRCKIKSRKQIDKEIPRDQQGWWADVAAGQKMLLRPAVQADIDRCHLGPLRSKNPDDYMCETQTDGSLVYKIALEYMNPEENVFAAIPAPPTSAEGVEHG